MKLTLHQGSKWAELSDCSEEQLIAATFAFLEVEPPTQVNVTPPEPEQEEEHPPVITPGEQPGEHPPVSPKSNPGISKKRVSSKTKAFRERSMLCAECGKHSATVYGLCGWCDKKLKGTQKESKSTGRIGRPPIQKTCALCDKPVTPENGFRRKIRSKKNKNLWVHRECFDDSKVARKEGPEHEGSETPTLTNSPEPPVKLHKFPKCFRCLKPISPDQTMRDCGKIGVAHEDCVMTTEEKEKRDREQNAYGPLISNLRR